jgi:hypothetical protein
MSGVLGTGAEGATFRDEDWYAEEIGAVRFAGCVFSDVDLQAAVMLAELQGAVVDLDD